MEEPTEGRKAESRRIEVTSDEGKNRFGELLNRAGFGGERIVITRFGKPVAGVVGLRDLEALEALENAAGSEAA
jgi:prevent-host-death family protein